MTTPTPGTDPQPTPADEPPPAAPRAGRLSISTTQLMASALAAITATVAASYLGVAGTVIGAAVASVLTVLGNAIYGHSIQVTRQRVRTVLPAGARWPAAGDPAPVSMPVPDEAQPSGRRANLQVMLAAIVGVFVGVLLVITAIEAIAGRPLSDLLRGDSGSGISILGGDGSGSSKHTPTPAVTVTVTPSVVIVTPTITFTGTAVTETATPTVTLTPTPTPTPASPDLTPSTLSAPPSTSASATP